MEHFTRLHTLLVHQIIFTYILVTSANKKGGIRLTDESGIITSPGYPRAYPNSIAFIWLINTTQSKYVELTFVDFDVESYKGCSADYVKIRNKKPSHGNFRDVPQIESKSKEFSINYTTKGPYCNRNRPPKIILSSSNLMAIVFISDSSVSRRGFKATYRSLDKKACGEVTNSNYGVVMTPGFPLTYPREGECLWLINVNENEYIRLEFDAFELDFNSQLCMDEIFIWDGKTSSSKLLLRGCRLSPFIIYSSSNHMRIKFTSRGYHRKRGFKAFYTTTATKGCGGRFYAENGTFLSPHYNLEAKYTYPAYSNCIWTVTAPKNHVISFKFTYFDVMAGDNGFCDEDYVQIFDGPSTRTRPIGKYCNIEKPNVITSSGNEMSMRFVSNVRKHGKGFRVQYRTHKTDCDSPLGMQDGRIPSHRVSASSFLRESPHFRPDSARLSGPYTWCSQIQTNREFGEFLQIDFGKPTQLTALATQGYMMTGTRQSYYITKYKLMYSNNYGVLFKAYTTPSVKNFDNKPKIFQGNSDSIGIEKVQLEQPIVAHMFRIIPVGYVHGRKRTICTKVEVYGCKFSFGDGYLIQSLDGHILYQGRSTSPRSNHWIISSSGLFMNTAIYVMPLYFKVSCLKAVLIISDGVQNNTYCGANQPKLYQIYSGNGQLNISLIALKDDLDGQNFGLEFFTENLGTGRVVRSPRGLVRGFRMNRSLQPTAALNVSKSTWIITVPPGRRIAARFTRMRVGTNEYGYCKDYVEIKDGLFGSSKAFGNFCRGVPMKPVLTSRNVMRVELHTRPVSERSRRGLATPFVAFEIVYTSLTTNGSSESEIMLLSADELTKKLHPDKRETSGVQAGEKSAFGISIALVVTAFCILAPT